MAKITHEVTAVTGTYKDRDGNEKKRYTRLGVVMETRNGPMLKIEAVPVGWDGWAYMNEPKAREGAKQQDKPAATQAAGDFADDDIPF